MSKTLLLADDSVTIQKIVGITFANEDIRLVTVDNGDDALIRARTLRPDLVLADTTMPGLSGYDLCSAIREDAELRNTPVLLLTGAFETLDEQRANSAGVTGFISKPFEAQVLVTKVEELLQGGAEVPLEPTQSVPESIAPALDAFPGGSPGPNSEDEASRSGSDAGDALFGHQDLLDPQPISPLSPFENFDRTRAESLDSATDRATSQELELENSAASRTGIGGTDLGDPDSPADVLADRAFADRDFETSVPADPAQTRRDHEAWERATQDSSDGPPTLPSFAESGLGQELTPSEPADISESRTEDSDLTSPAGASEISPIRPRIGDTPFELERTSHGAEQAAEGSGPAADAGGQGYADPASLTGESPTMLQDLDSWRADAATRTSSEDPFVPESSRSLPEDDHLWASEAPAGAMPGTASGASDTPADSLSAAEWSTEWAASPATETPRAEALRAETPSIPSPDPAAPADAPGVSPRLAQEVTEALEKIAWDAFGPLSEQIVSQVMRKVEEIAWEAVPLIAERLVRAEIDRLKVGDDDSEA